MISAPPRYRNGIRLCDRCTHGQMVGTDEDGDPLCLACGYVAVRREPLPYVKNGHGARVGMTVL